MKEKFIRKYMAFAKFIGEDQPVCYSRSIGAVITNAEGTRILGTGYNGPPRGVPHCDTPQFLDYIERETGIFLRAGQKKCPRKLLGIPSGQGLEFCPAQHAERNAITNAACDLTGAVMFCWCPMPCMNCAGAIIQAGLSKVYCLEGSYDSMSDWLFQHSKVVVCYYKGTL